MIRARLVIVIVFVLALESISTAQQNSARIQLVVPEDAVVVINGFRTRTTGTHRRYVSHDLTPGRVHTFHVRADVVRDGQRISETRDIPLTVGDSKSLTLKLDPKAEQTDRNPDSTPEPANEIPTGEQDNGTKVARTSVDVSDSESDREAQREEVPTSSDHPPEIDRASPSAADPAVADASRASARLQQEVSEWRSEVDKLQDLLSKAQADARRLAKVERALQQLQQHAESKLACEVDQLEAGKLDAPTFTKQMAAGGTIVLSWPAGAAVYLGQPTKQRPWRFHPLGTTPLVCRVDSNSYRLAITAPGDHGQWAAPAAGQQQHVQLGASDRSALTFEITGSQPHLVQAFWLTKPLSLAAQDQAAQDAGEILSIPNSARFQAQVYRALAGDAKELQARQVEQIEDLMRRTGFVRYPTTSGNAIDLFWDWEKQALQRVFYEIEP